MSYRFKHAYHPERIAIIGRNRRLTRTTEDKMQPLSLNMGMCHQKWLPYKILGGKTVKNVQFDPQTTEIWPKELSDPSVSE